MSDKFIMYKYTIQKCIIMSDECVSVELKILDIFNIFLNF